MEIYAGSLNCGWLRLRYKVAALVILEPTSGLTNGSTDLCINCSKPLQAKHAVRFFFFHFSFLICPSGIRIPCLRSLYSYMVILGLAFFFFFFF